MKILSSLLISLLLLTSSHSDATVEGYSFNASRFAKKSAPTTTVDSINYETIKHHTRHRKYHSALNISRNVSNVTITFHTKQELTELRGRNVNGFSRVRRDGSCEIHVMMPYNWNDDDAMRTVGHELMHCFGAVHERGENKKERRAPKATPALHRLAQKATTTMNSTSAKPSAAPLSYQMAVHNNTRATYKLPQLVEKSRAPSNLF